MKKLTEIKALEEYLATLIKLKDKCMILIAVQGEWWQGVSPQLAKQFVELGIQTDFSTKQDCSYIAVLDEEKLVYESVGNKMEVCQYKCKYEGSALEIISKSRNSRFVNAATSSIGIIINNERVTFAKRGISVAVYNKYTKDVADAVTFDTYFEKAKAFRANTYNKLLFDRVLELQVGFGYSIAQWLYDFGFDNVTLCIEPQFIDLGKVVALSLKTNECITVKNRFSSLARGYKLEYVYNSQFTAEGFFPFDILEINKNETVINISPFPNSILRTLAEKRGCHYFELPELLEEAFSYIRAEEAVVKLLSKTGGVKAFAFSLPKIASDKSGESKRLIRNGVNRIDGIKLLQNGERNSEGISRYIREDEKYTNEEWCELLCWPNPESYYNEKGYRVWKERKGKHVNITEKHRVTTDAPDDYDNTIYIFGGCNVFGIYNADEDTFSSELQRRLNSYTVNGKKYCVKNYGHFLQPNWIDLIRVISSIVPKEGDIIMFQQSSSKRSKYPCLRIDDCKTPKDIGYLYFDAGNHFTPNSHRFVAEKIYEYLNEKSFLENVKQDFEYKTRPIPLCGFERGGMDSQNSLPEEYRESLEQYKNKLREVRIKEVGKIGSIVMNCNPFTLGHQYLVEYAASKVKHLFIFAVEEDKSIFPFNDRFELMKQGTADLENVTVLPSGNFIISSITFADYFNKAEIQDRTIDPSQDVELFAEEIAPALGITVRFAGEEPLDKVTNQYNEAMSKILPKYGIEFEVIPRKENGGEVISASRVRKLLEAKDFDMISRIVPKTTLHYLEKRFKK